MGARRRRRRSPEEKELRDCADLEEVAPRLSEEAVLADWDNEWLLLAKPEEEMDGSRNMDKLVMLPADELEFCRDGFLECGSEELCWRESEDEEEC
jgi:hypothetical protein